MDLQERQAVGQRLAESAAEARNTIVLLGIDALQQLVLLTWVYHLIRHDVTERRRVTSELQRRGELLEAANKDLEAFSYSVSHDLRAPLRHIDGYAALLRKSVEAPLNDKAARYLQTISDSAKQMGQLIDDLLVFSRIGRQEMLHATVNRIRRLGTSSPICARTCKDERYHGQSLHYLKCRATQPCSGWYL